ncbi:hypothetical protein TNCV_1609771 [Trichonephila clavipes]|nr:hypothetical protein TNCV_1609771 [Trichonephila clavipes]
MSHCPCVETSQLHHLRPVKLYDPRVGPNSMSPFSRCTASRPWKRLPLLKAENSLGTGPRLLLPIRVSVRLTVGSETYVHDSDSLNLCVYYSVELDQFPNASFEMSIREPVATRYDVETVSSLIIPISVLPISVLKLQAPSIISRCFLASFQAKHCNCCFIRSAFPLMSV